MISVKDLKQYQKEPKTIVIDLRDKIAYQEHHIPHAVNIPYEQWQEEKELWRHQYDTVIFYCERGNRSMYAAKEMIQRGYRAMSIAGGYQGYRIVMDRKETAEFEK